MDESVEFVQELRSGDSDICIFETDETIDISLNLGRGHKRQCKKPKKRMPLIDLSKDSGSFEVQATKNEKVDLGNSVPSSTTESKKIDQETQRINLECPVCFESLQNLEIKVTSCGHMLCANCMDIIVNNPKPNCPKCRKVIIKKTIRRVFL